MKHRISYSLQEELYQVETKRIFGKWETRKNYLFTDGEGNVVNSRGFFTYEHALEWVTDRYPDLKILNKTPKNSNISFDF